MFEIIGRDAAGRLGKFYVGSHVVRTPNIAIVVNPNIQEVSARELRKLGAEILITNSYIISRHQDLREAALSKGLHGLLDWDGPVYTDSGAFQMYSQGVSNIDPSRIIEFQKAIKSDIITPLDVFTVPEDTKTQAALKLKETLARYAAVDKGDRFLAGPIQGGLFPDLRKKACLAVNKMDFDVHAIGGIVPLMEAYRYRELAQIVTLCKKTLMPTKPVHAFGAGHPMLFAFLAALGCDLFDSAMYSIAAKRGGYLTTGGTLRIGELKELPCSCEICASHTAAELKDVKLLSLHNLHVTFAEMRTVREAIRGEWLWELVQQRARAHPRLLEALIHVLKTEGKWLATQDKATKRSAFMVSGAESAYRPEVVRARILAKNVSGKTFSKEPFGKIPVALAGIYPFGQSVTLDDKDVAVDPKKAVTATIDYLYGRRTNRAFKKLRVELSRTGRPRRVYDGKEMVGTIRAYDGVFIPTMLGAEKLMSVTKSARKCVRVSKDATEFVAQGKSVFSKFVAQADKNIVPGEEVFLTDYRGKLIATGTALLNGAEMGLFQRGMAVETRTHYDEK